MADNDAPRSKDFIREIIEKDLEAGKNDGRLQTRFPPEPNGYLHIGHAKAISLSFGVAEEYKGVCNLRFDDTNPEKEKTEFVEAIQEDIQWLGYTWGNVFYASDYFDQLYDWAVQLIKADKAYVCDLTEEEVREYRGTAGFSEDKRETPAGKNSPHRDRSIEENLDLFGRMRNGEFPDGAKTLRAKIDMAHPNLNMRDPVMYRILHREHFRQGDKWCIYPTYDWTHGQSDSIEGVTHSLCDTSFENHRPLYDWFLDELGAFHSRQYEFGRMTLTYTILSKRFLRQLVEQGHVSGWDDPRMPTLCGFRRRGFTPEAVRDFCARLGYSKGDGVVDLQYLEQCQREHLNKIAPRVMAVLDPIKVVITNYPEDQVDELEAVNNPEDPSAGTRTVLFSRELYIERSDFMEDPPKKFFRLGVGREVRLRYAYYMTCQEAIKNDAGEVIELRCTYDPATKGGDSPDGRKVKGTIHWVSAQHAIKSQVRLYEYLFKDENPKPKDGDWVDILNPESVTVLEEAYIEPSIADAPVGYRCQFERNGYFTKDKDSTPEQLIFNRTVALKDSWKKIQTKNR
ncbi:MAG: glutamine--tRNA ligase/YqeY domain fusion protein [Candidatus Hinthialibacter antarcticus]|nr:glutamine--tRNA ligase/YqeY domain fusion protein [Candidatus Hinthialibacter antarcticus]